MFELLIVAIAVVVLAVLVIVVFILLKLKKQQENLYRPELYFDSFAALVYNMPIVGFNELFEFKRYKLNYMHDPAKQFGTDYCINLPYNLRNIGMGVAKKVEAKWIFDATAAIQSLEKILPENIEAELMDETLWLKNNEPVLWEYMPFEDLKKPQLFKYILPTSKETSSRDEAIPKSIITIYLCHFIFGTKLHEDKFALYHHYAFEGLPKPVLELNYTDINDKPFKKQFEVELTIFSPSDEKDEDNRTEVDGRLQLGILSLEVKEI